MYAYPILGTDSAFILRMDLLVRIHETSTALVLN